MPWMRWWERKPRALYIDSFGAVKKVKISPPKWDAENQVLWAESTWDLLGAQEKERLIFRDGTGYEIVQALFAGFNTTKLILTKNVRQPPHTKITSVRSPRRAGTGSMRSADELACDEARAIRAGTQLLNSTISGVGELVHSEGGAEIRSIFDTAKEAFSMYRIEGSVERLTREQYIEELIAELWAHAYRMAKLAMGDKVCKDDCKIWQTEAVHYPGSFCGSVGHFVERTMSRDVITGMIEASVAAELYISAEVRDRCNDAIAEAVRRAYDGPQVEIKTSVGGRLNGRRHRMDANKALIDAARAGNIKAVSRWLDASADVNVKDGDSMTPLHWAAAAGWNNIVKLLLDRGADLNARETLGHTPLHLAAFEGRAKTVSLLLDHRADLNAKNRFGKMALAMILEEARKRKRFRPLVDRLKESHPDLVMDWWMKENDNKA